MSTTQLLEQLTELSDVERLEVIEAATRLIRKNLTAGTADAAMVRDQRTRVAAARVRELYESDSELTEWAVLDGEEFVDANLPR